MMHFACEFDGHGGSTALDGAGASAQLHADALAWVHMDATKAETREWLRREVHYLDNIILDALLAEETRPRVMEIGNGLMLILRGMNLNEGAEPEDMIALRMWIDPHRIITLVRRPLKAIDDIHTGLLSGNGAVSAGDFLVRLSERLFARMQPVLDELESDTDRIEVSIDTRPETVDRDTIVDIRQQAIVFRRYIAPQRDVMNTLRVSPLPWLDDLHRRYLQENYDRLCRYVEDLDEVRDRAQVVKDELANALSERLNHNMYVLSVIAAIFLPLGFLTGLLGINVGGMPGADNPQAFWWFTGALVVLVALQLVLFRRLRWL